MAVLSGSSSWSAWFFLIALVTIIYRSAGKPSQLIVCSQPDSFTVQITENERVVYGTELLIRYNPRVGIFSYPEIKPVNVVFDEAVIEFKGRVSSEHPVNQRYTSSEKLSWNASGIILGIGTLQKLSKDDYAVQDCRLFLPTDIKGSTNLPRAVEEAIIYYAQSCAKQYLCQRIGILKAEQLQHINSYNEYGYNIARVIRPNIPRVDLCMNVPVEIFLKKAINYIKQNERSIITIPSVTETYNMGLGMKCHFDTNKGTFEDLSTLKRTDDAVMSNVGRTQIIQAGFGLSMARFKYNYYKLRVGLITVSGNILGTVNGLAIAAKLIIDYDKTCGINLEYVKVTKLGEIKLEMTGLGPLNSLTSKVLTWLTRMWKDRIVKAVEVNARNIAEEQLSEFICKNDEVASSNISLNYNYTNFTI
ncbi:PREDICTED: uncharacterized protein LOC105563308 [Vollenhovia emeryi]|uniref:uncharacterized protein LOC105563308 n=1 Tax=Vollenhovia emeryi TaxID=411798 RepID=UPI0005F57745|nr:PREDICTED: uncharacterized protein LOC105563308 [Vollenhovia emeryi]